MQSNTVANVSLGSAIGLVVLFLVSFCIGMIPFVSLLNLFILPIECIVALVGLITGVIGLVQARKMDGAGMAQSIVGIVVPLLWGLFYFVMVGLAVVLGVLVVVMENM